MKVPDHNDAWRPTFSPSGELRRGFTLIELLVSLAIIGVLLSLVLPLASRAVRAARGFKCQVSLRNSAYDFSIFADDQLHGDRGRDRDRETFGLDTFVASQYCLEEFWCWDPDDRHDVTESDAAVGLRCPEISGSLVLRRQMACQSGGVSPWQNVSYGFNARLRFIERNSPLPGPRYLIAKLDTSILSQSAVPLAWDVDGEAASQIGTAPFYSAPSLDSPLLFVNNQYWFPGMRHNGAMNVVFVDGHVESSATPLQQTRWRWGFVPTH